MTEFKSIEADNSANLSKKLNDYPVLKAFVAGAISGIISTTIFQPLDLVKTRLQVSHQSVLEKPGGMFPIIVSVLKQENVTGLWKGMTPSLMRCVPGVGLYFSSLHALRTKFVSGDNTLKPIEAVILGITARTIAGICMMPFTVLKTRYESGVYKYTGFGAALKTIYRTEGGRGFILGLIPTLFRDAPFSGFYLMFYTQTKHAVPRTWLEGTTSAPVQFSCGVVAGILASFVTQPADVIKTKMQLYPDKFRTTVSAVYYVQQQEGYRGYFKGLVPRLIRKTLVAAMAWTVYEQICRNIGLK